VRTALIGAGRIAREHLAYVRELPGVEVAAVCDRSPAAAECAAERFGIPSWFTDHRVMLEDVRPDIVHVTTPPTSHFRLAMDSLKAGAHVIVEKPVTSTLDELEALAHRAEELGRVLVEDHNYLFDRAPREILGRIESGQFGAVTHVEVLICLDLRPGGFMDPNSPHPTLALAGGAIADFLPHLASLAFLFVGPHRRVRTVWTKRTPSVLPYDEFHAVVEAERGTATLGLSANSQPDAFWLRVYGERMQATANLFETRLTFNGMRSGPRPLRSFLDALAEGRAIRRSAFGSLFRKLGRGPAALEGLREVIGGTYRALADDSALPVPIHQVLAVNRLVADLKPEAHGS
jgi:predicted dehydrogenase